MCVDLFQDFLLLIFDSLILCTAFLFDLPKCNLDRFMTLNFKSHNLGYTTIAIRAYVRAYFDILNDRTVQAFICNLSSTE